MKACPCCDLIGQHSEYCYLRIDLAGFTPAEVADLQALRRRREHHPDELDRIPFRYASGKVVEWPDAIRMQTVVQRTDRKPLGWEYRSGAY